MTRQRRLTRYERRLLQTRAARKRDEKEADLRAVRTGAFLARVLIATVLLIALALLLEGTARKARGAVRVPLTWTAPAWIERYECRVVRQDGYVASAGLTGDSLGLLPLTIQPAGQRQTAWALVSENWRAGGTTFWVRGCNAAGCAPWSNAVVVLAAVPDTNWMLERPARSGYLAPVGGKVWKRAAGRVWFALQPGDTTVPATILHQEDVQRAARARLCATNGTWALRGGSQPCP